MTPTGAQPVGRAEPRGGFGVGEPSSPDTTASSPLEASERIVAINRFYWPDEAPTSQLLKDVAEHLASRGHSVTIVASRLGYRHSGRSLLRRERRNGVDIVRVWTSGLGRRHALGRAVDYLTFYLSATLALARNLDQGDTLLVKTDPPLMVVPACLIARFKRARLVHWCQDLFPEVAAALGMKIAKGPAGGLLRWLRDLALRSADVNIAISDRMRDRLVRAGIEQERIRIIANWSVAKIEPLPVERNPLRQAWGLDQGLVIGYSGNLGRAHIPEAVFELVDRLADRADLRFLFVGEGVGMHWLRARCEQANHQHVVFKPHQPNDKLSSSLSVPDLHLVSLHPACEGLMMPSKLYGILAAARPVLFLGDPHGEVADVIGRSGAGVALDSAAPETWTAELAPIFADSSWTRHRGAMARQAFEAAYTPDAALARWSAALGIEADAPAVAAVEEAA